MEKELEMTERANRAKKKVGEYVERKTEEDEDVGRKRKNSEGETREEPMEEEERVEVREAEKRKRNDELTADDVRRCITSADIESPQLGPQLRPQQKVHFFHKPSFESSCSFFIAAR